MHPHRNEWLLFNAAVICARRCPMLQGAPQGEMHAALRLAVVAVPMGVLLSRTMAWMSSGKTHADLVSRLRGKELPRRVMLLTVGCRKINDRSKENHWVYCMIVATTMTVLLYQIMGSFGVTECLMPCWQPTEGFTPETILMQTLHRP